MFDGATETPQGADRAAALAVAAWFELHVDAIHAYASRRVGPDIGAEVAAETFRTALESFGRYDSALGSERAWLYGIASNVLRRHWRVEQRRLRAYTLHGSVAGPSSIDPLLGVDEHVDAQRQLTTVMKGIERLESIDRDLLFLSAWEGCSSAEVASALGLRPSTVRRRLQRIRAELRQVKGVDQ